MYLALALASALGALGGCTSPPPPAGWQTQGRQWFDAEFLTGFGQAGQAVGTLRLSIPYRNLVFFRRGDGFEANYRVRAIQRTLDGEPLRMREWAGHVRVDTYEQTRESVVSRETLTLDLIDPATAPEAGMLLEVQVLVEGTGRRGSTLLPVSFNRLEEGGLSLGELALYRPRDPSAMAPQDSQVLQVAMLPDENTFRRQMNRTFDLASGQPWLLVRVFDLRAGPPTGGYEIAVRVFAAGSSDARWSQVLRVGREGTESAALIRLPVAALRFGENRIVVDMVDAEAQEILLENLGLDLEDDESWKRNLAQIEVLASGDEMDALKDAAAGEREAAWRAFWKRRDPDPSTKVNERLEEHYRRVSHARSTLRDGYRDGAMSDRGKVYVLHGAPEAIETTTEGLDSIVTYEIWRYAELGLAYYFQDVDGLGNYRLVWRERV
jgi:GWxTD domain-containing protein